MGISCLTTGYSGIVGECIECNMCNEINAAGRLTHISPQQINHDNILLSFCPESGSLSEGFHI